MADGAAGYGKASLDKAILDASILEEDYQQTLIELAQSLGWLVAHFRRARTTHGWRTPVAANGKGFPDLVLVRERTIYVEVKTETGKVDPAQREWHERLRRAGQTVYVWRPRDYEDAERMLRAEVS